MKEKPWIGGKPCGEPPGEGRGVPVWPTVAAAPRAPQGSARCLLIPKPQPCMLQLDGTPHSLGVLPGVPTLSKKSSSQQALQERAKPALEHLEWGWKEERLAAFFYY